MSDFFTFTTFTWTGLSVVTIKWSKRVISKHTYYFHICFTCTSTSQRNYLWRRFHSIHLMKRDPLTHFHPQYPQFSLLLNQTGIHLYTTCERLTAIPLIHGPWPCNWQTTDITVEYSQNKSIFRHFLVKKYSSKLLYQQINPNHLNFLKRYNVINVHLKEH